MNKQREVVYSYRNEIIDSEDPRKLVYEVIDEAVPAKVDRIPRDRRVERGTELRRPAELGEHHLPARPNEEKAQFETRAPEENAQFLIEKIKEAYERKSSHEEPTAVKSLERYIILNAIDRLWQEHLYAMDALREGVYLRGYAQKDPLIEYKTEAYDMFVELMANIKNEVLHNLFRSTSNLQAFENFLSTLPQFLMREQAPAAARPVPGRRPERIGAADRRERRRGWRRRGSKARTCAGAPRDAESRPERAVSVRQRQEIQELLRPRRLTSAIAPSAASRPRECVASPPRRAARRALAQRSKVVGGSAATRRRIR